MLMEKGTATSLRDMGEKFLTFAQKSNDTTQAWKLVDDRLHSFYGATLEIPITKEVTKYKWEEYEETQEITRVPAFYYNSVGGFFSIFVDGKKYHILDMISYKPQYETTNTVSFKINIFNVKKDSALYGDVDKTIAYYNRISNTDLNVLVFPLFPKEQNMNYLMSEDDTFLKSIKDRLNDLHYDCVVDLSKLLKQKDIEFYDGSIDWTNDSSTVSTYEPLSLYTYNGITYPDLQNNYMANCELKRFSTQNPISAGKYDIKYNLPVLYTKEAENRIKDYFEHNVKDILIEKDIERFGYKDTITVKKKRKVPDDIISTSKPYFYISLQHTDIKTTTYNDWVRKNIDFPFYRAQDFNGKNSEGITHHNYQAETFNANTKEILAWNRQRDITINSHYSPSGNIINPFVDTGEFLAIGAHTLFEEDLWLCEQPQITCETEAREQTNRQNLAPSRRIYYDYGRADSDIALPSFPSVGCPWFTLSDKNKQEFSNIEYWFTKNDYSATITFRVRRKADWKYVYQSMSFGMMDCVDDSSYKFPLFVAGGTEGLVQDIWVFGRIYGGTPTYTQGNLYTLDVENIALSNGNLLNPCKFNGSNVSNFRILTPEGIWRDIFAWEQHADVVHHYSCGATYNWGYPLSVPKKLGGLTYHGAFPIVSDINYTIDTHRKTEEYDQMKFSTPFTRVIVYLNDKLDHNENGIYGFLPSNYMLWSKTIPSGEVEISGKKYLVVPNGWDNRLLNYPVHVGEVVNNEWQNEGALKRIEQPMSNQFVTKMIIPLEEGA